MSTSYLTGLNNAQLKAVTAPEQNLLVIAGAGTGKTRVIVSRIAYILNEFQDPPRSILAVTFTNKAALELKERVQKACVGINDLNMLWAGTFHAICARFLRSYCFAANLPASFTIMDPSDVKRELKHIIEPLNLNLKGAELNKLLGSVSETIFALKEKGLRAQQLLSSTRDTQYEITRRFRSELTFDEFVQIYLKYEEFCETVGAVDFSELLLRTCELFNKHPEILSLQHRRFKHILVDEFQDTNHIQYKLVQLLCGENCTVMAVGDDDQSIYSWRGANYRNMPNFLRDFKDAKLIALEENYRSSQNVLDLANSLMSGCEDRLSQKVLQSQKGAGQVVEVVECPNNYQEAQWVASTMSLLHNAGVPYQEMAVLYRFNSQSNPLENAFSTLGIPYNIWGGLRFFDREEIQNSLAYLRLAVNENDNAALLRIINVPKRAIGPSKIKLIENIATEHHCSHFKAIELLLETAKDPAFKKAYAAKAKSFKDFYDLVLKIKENLETQSLQEALHFIHEQTGLNDFYTKKDKDEGKNSLEGRVANLKELEENAARFEEECKVNPILDSDGNQIAIPLLFITNTSLVSGGEINSKGEKDSLQDAANLSTIHSAKGLEYQVVFVVGFEDSILPSAKGNTLDEFEEERRLAYVAITRAKEKLFLSYCNMRTNYQGTNYTGPSVFLTEILKDVNKTHQKEQLPYKERSVSYSCYD